MLHIEISWEEKTLTGPFSLICGHLTNSVFPRLGQSTEGCHSLFPHLGPQCWEHQADSWTLSSILYLQMLKCYFEVWMTPWLHKADVPVSLCHWPTFVMILSWFSEDLPPTRFFLSGLWGQNWGGEHLHRITTKPLSQSLLVPPHTSKEDAQDLSDKEKTCLDWMYRYPAVYLFC